VANRGGHRKPINFAIMALVGLVLVTVPLPAFSQSCALCYTQAAASGQRMIEALKSGILILIVPPTLMTIFMIGILYHKRNQCRAETSADLDGNW
jgi:hypothetical protein